MYHAAPTTDRDMASPVPVIAHMYGDVESRNLHGKQQPILAQNLLIDTLTSISTDNFYYNESKKTSLYNNENVH